MDHPEEEIILGDDEEKYDDVINEEEGGCEVVWQSSRESISVEILEPQCDNKK